uniref:Uncharacterized protein n=1 Tax=Rhizophora mucronata TaxID=61149 RepID=A0A2P2P7C5_RHIMU
MILMCWWRAAVGWRIQSLNLTSVRTELNNLLIVAHREFIHKK